MESETINIRPPIKRGDITKLIDKYDPGSIAIVDGTFHAYPAVGHAELLDALKKGWRIWGLSSMGAIRACEMSNYGLKGYGKVYELFQQNKEYSDDEVTLLHEKAHPYIPLSEPMIHIRSLLDHAVNKNSINNLVAEKITHQMKNQWYGLRTLNSLSEMLLQEDCDNAATSKLIENFDQFRIKTHDAIDFITSKPWLDRRT
ncbi:TfuA-like protein [Pseudomonas sp. O230]|uniref:TfuA-like protein n=1 Tax=Pseudomonas sp. O230 TaxID=3159450 RepID=UPI00387B37B1